MKMKIVVLSALIGIATSLGLDAKTVQWPEKSPSFSMTVPDGWTCGPIRDTDLQCNSDDEAGPGFEVVPKKWNDKEEMKAMLPSIGEKLANATNLTAVEKGKVQETTSAGNVKLLRLDTAGKKGATELILWLVAFKTGNNPYMMVTGALPKTLPEHQKQIAQILNSIAPVESEKTKKPSPREFDPYHGSLTTLLPAEFSDSVLKFKRTATTDKTSSWTEHGATEAVSFNYDLIAIVIVKIEGGLVNFRTSADAVAALEVTAAGHGATVAPKGNGQRFSAQNGQIIGWTNGSVLCLVAGGTGPAAGNFEKGAPF